ncbi:hypothetical protein [Carboxydothermus hydrogenoformans]|nr:hypothetical protein [Carboxydothermus hydrogenoformans]
MPLLTVVGGLWSVVRNHLPRPPAKPGTKEKLTTNDSPPTTINVVGG